MTTPRKIVYLMRGLPSSGKSTLARELAGETGVVCETDQFFYTQVGESAKTYDYVAERLDEARAWNLERFRDALKSGASPIVIDRGNGLNRETHVFAQLAREYSYEVELREPDSPWWRELRVLLKYREHLAPAVLDRWAEVLADVNRKTHRVPVATIRRWMQMWRSDLSVQDILDWRET